MPRAPINTSQPMPAGAPSFLQKPGTVTPNGAFLAARPTTKDPDRRHLGVDIAGAKGTSVYAPHLGRITDVWTDNVTKPFSGYGPGGVMLLASDGTWHLLGHLEPSTIAVAVGDYVSDGQFIGETSDENHVHWEIRSQRMWNAKKGHASWAYNPADWLPKAFAAATLGELTSPVLSAPATLEPWDPSDPMSALRIVSEPDQVVRPVPGAPSFSTAVVLPPAPPPARSSPWAFILAAAAALLLLGKDKR